MSRGRPRRWRSIRVTSFYIPDEFEPVFEKLREMAASEGVPLNQKILDAIYQYVSLYSSGGDLPNPPEPMRFVKESEKVEAEMVAADLQEVVKEVKDPRLNESYRIGLVREVLPKLLKRLATLNSKLQNPNFTKLCRDALSLYKEVSFKCGK